MAACIGKRLFFAVFVFFMAGFSGTLLAADVFSASDREQANRAVMRTVLGILSFVRWPMLTEPLTLCVSGEVQFAALLTDELRLNNGQSLRVEHHSESESLSLSCNVLYLGQLPAISRQALFQRFLDKPTLLISEADDECVVGIMFCLAVSKEQVHFTVNLDSLARSTVRVHPNVLKLARGRS